MGIAGAGFGLNPQAQNVIDEVAPVTQVVFRAQQLAHALRVEAGHLTPLGTAQEIKTAVSAAVQVGNYVKGANGVIRGVVTIQGVAHEFTCGTNAAGQIIFSNIYRIAP